MDLDTLNNKLCRLVKENNLAAENELLMANEGLIVSLAGSMEVAYDLDINHWGGIYKEDITTVPVSLTLQNKDTYRYRCSVEKVRSKTYNRIKPV